jgi:ABC-type multidrug transport system fused ATPase/permease subunit
LKVSTTNATSHHNHDPYNTLLIVLLCLTVLWINAQAFVFRTLLDELTREEGLFLPPEVHRHPMYFQDDRGLAMHWCDLCRKRISAGCYRCSLCDFDVCGACAKRNDAATVGENVLRGDRGVRVETNLSTVGYFQRSLQVAKTELPLLLVSFSLLALSSISRLLLPHYQGHIIDKVIPQEDGEYDKAGFLRYIQVYIWIMLVQGALSTIYSAIFTLVSRRLKFTIRNALLEKILVQDMAYFDGTESGRLISRLTNDLDLMMSPIQSSLSSLLSNILILFGGMVMCFYKSYRLSMLAFVTVGPISYLWEQYALWSKGLAREMLSHWAEGNSIASQALSHVRTVKAFGCEDKVLEKYTETNQQALHCGVKDAWGNGITSALTGYLDLGSGVLILYFGGLLVYNGELSVGELVTFQLFWNLMNNAYQNLQGLITSFTRSAAGAEKVFSLWDSDPDIDPKKGRDITWDVQGNLQLQDVTFYYQMRPDNIVLKKFSLDIPGGKTIALVGRSGGGKSTIINLLLRFYDPREGKLVLDGKDYESLQVHQLRRLFGVVTQETELFALTVEENIAYGLDKDEYTMEDVVNAAKKAFAHEFISEMKDGYQTRIGERGNRLSGGQRQRLAIARVFLRRPKIILLDEATSALDENSQEAVHKALSNLIAESNATVVLVAHRLSTVVNADCICVIDQGSVLEQGDHDELVAKGGIYASMVEKQMKKKSDLLEQEQQGKGDDQMTAKKQASIDDIDSLLADKK